MDLARYTALFLSDSRDHIQRCNELLLGWERAPGSPFPTTELFRSFHSLKGSSATLGHEAVAELAHAGEQLLAAIRDDVLVPSRELVDFLFQALDAVSEGVEAIGRGEEAPRAEALLPDLLARVPASTRDAPRVERRAVPRPDPPLGASQEARASGRQVRVELERLDALLNQVNELVVARNRLAAIADREIGSELEQLSGRVSGLVSRLHGTVLRARLAPMQEVFAGFPRLVRDLGRELGKEVHLELLGAEIELDRSVLDSLADPLTHLIRNAVDHGIETPVERVEAGKPREGTVRVRAERTPEAIILTVADDGRGIDRAAVLRRAVELGLLLPEAPLPSAADLLRLLAQPGFTTSASVTRVSGRGVGLDAVLDRVRALGGRIELKTTPGRGATVLLRLPASRTLLGVLVVRTNGERYAIPFSAIAEAAMQDGDDREVTFRGEALPTADLGRMIGLGEPPAQRRPAIVVERGGRRTALVVDALLGRQDVVLEPFAMPAGLPPWIAGATILPDGAPALLLDPGGLF
ncbi:MAG: chemotaxis protein CheA [Gemmatimonadales bacterium]